MCAGCASTTRSTDDATEQLGGSRDVPAYVYINQQLYAIQTDQYPKEHGQNIGKATNGFQVYALPNVKSEDQVIVKTEDGNYLYAVKSIFTKTDAWFHIKAKLENVFHLDYSKYKADFATYQPKITIAVPKGSDNKRTFATTLT